MKTKIRAFISENFMMAQHHQELLDSESLFGKGILDSTGVLELVGFIEETYDIQVDDEELIPANLDSIDNLVTFVESKRSRPC